MKRFFFLFLTVVFSLCLFAFPTFAYEEGTEPYLFSEYINENMVVFDDPIEDGFYTLTVAFTDDLIPFIQTPVFAISETVDFYFDNVLNPDEHLHLWGGLQPDGTYSFYLATVYSDGDFEYMFPSEPNYDFYVAVYSEPVPSDTGNVLSDIGDFFTYCMTCLADVAVLIVSSPALLILSIGFILIIFVVVVVKRF